MKTINKLEELPGNLSIDDAKQLLQSLINRDLEIENDLKQNLKLKSQIDSQMETFDFEIPEYLTLSYSKSKELNERINSTCTLAETLSSQVKYLDGIRERIKVTLKKVDDIVDLKNCINGVQESIQKEDYESAAFHINRYLNIDKSVLEPTSSEMLSKAESELLQMIEQRYDAAIKSGNVEEVTRFCKLYVPLERAQEGLDKYCQFLHKHHSKSLDSVMTMYSKTLTSVKSPSQQQKVTAYHVIRATFKEYSAIIEENLDLVKNIFGISYCAGFLLLITKQSDYFINKVFDYFAEYQVSNNIKDILLVQKSQAGGGLTINSTGSSQQSMDPRTLTPILDEIILISKSCKFFELFLLKKVAKIKEDTKLEMGDSSVQIKFHSAMFSTTFKQRVNQLLGDYLQMEEFFMVESVNKAIQADQPTPNKLTSSMVDYIFFVLQKSLSRAIDSCHSQTLNVISNKICRILVQCRDNLQRAFRDQIIKSSSIESIQSSFIILNNIETFADYITKLKKEMEVKAERTKGVGDSQEIEEDKEKVSMILNEFQNTSKSFQTLLGKEIDSLFKSIQPRLKKVLEMFNNVNYEIHSQLEYDSNDINDPFVLQFTMEISQFLKPFQEYMTPGNYEQIVHQTIYFILKKIESSLFQHKKFTLLGSLQFSKDLRTISNYFTKISQSTTRDKFSKLNQMASFLTLDSISEIQDYWTENMSSNTWKLSSSELKKLLLNRVDLSGDQIMKLKI